MSPPSTTLAAGAPAVRPTAEQIAELRGAVRRFIGARVKEAATADDLTQDVFLKVMRQLEHVRDPRRIMGWIFSIARHEVADHFRRARPTEEFQEARDIAPPARPDEIPRAARPRDGAGHDPPLLPFRRRSLWQGRGMPAETLRMRSTPRPGPKVS